MPVTLKNFYLASWGSTLSLALSSPSALSDVQPLFELVCTYWQFELISIFQGQEYTERFLLEFQREDGGEWTRFKDKLGNEVSGLDLMISLKQSLAFEVGQTEAWFK